MKRLGLLLLIVSLMGMGFAAAQDNPTPVPTSTETNTPAPTAMVSATPGPSPTPIVIDPVLNIAIEPPLQIDVPDNWEVGYYVHLYRDLDERVETVPWAIYRGPIVGYDETGELTEVTGTIILLWGFNSVLNPFSQQSGLTNPWLDGQRMMRVVLFDARCVLGLAPQKEYTIGTKSAVGTQFSAVDCPQDPDTRGWFAALVVEDINFAFYAYADPIQPVDSPFEAELQTILDTVEFNVAERMISQEELDATREALLLTPTATPVGGE